MDGRHAVLLKRQVCRGRRRKWVHRFLAEGTSGLEDRSSAPHRRPTALSAQEVRRILSARRRTNWGPHRLGPVLGHPRSTVYGVLRREGVPRLRDLDRPTRAVIRYEKARPGEIVHIDVKKVGRIPAGGGHRMLGRSTTTRRMKLRAWAMTTYTSLWTITPGWPTWRRTL
jgi:hypothetical protein